MDTETEQPTWERKVGDRVAIKYEPENKGTITARVIMWEEPCYNIKGDDGSSVTGILDDDLMDIDSEPKRQPEGHRKRYDATGCRLTNCCGCYSTFMDANADPNDDTQVLCCKKCHQVVPLGEGDGSETIYDRGN